MQLPQASHVVEVLVKKWGKLVQIKRFILPNGDSQDFLSWGGTTTPTIIFPVTPDNSVIAVEQFRYGAECLITELPGGCPEGSQNPEEVLRAELAQETGYLPRQVIRLGEPMFFEPAACRTQYHAYLALDCEKVGEPEPDASEIMQVKLFNLSDWVGMISQNQINDSKSIAVTWRALAHMGWKFSPPNC